MAVLAVDLGGTELRAGLVDAAGSLLATLSTATDASGGPAAVVEQIAALVGALRSRATEPVHRLGIAAPGPLDPSSGTVLAAPTLAGWQDVPLAGMLRTRLGLDIVLENDANAAALGEWRFGAGRGTDAMVFVTVSTGIGGGVVIDGRLLHGRRGLAAEIGHMSIAASEPCVCGGVGCWEAMASGSALAREAAATIASGGAPCLAQLAGGNAVTGRHVEVAARRGDAVALALLDAEACWLGVGLANLLHLYSPERIVLGGGVMACFDLLRPRMLDTMRTRAMAPYRDVPVMVAELGAASGLMGAASLVI